MVFINDNYSELNDSFFFADIRKKVNDFKTCHQEVNLIHMGIGDVTLPLAPVVLAAMHEAVEEMGKKETFHGYGPEPGYHFLKEAIRDWYGKRRVTLDEDEIFIGEGVKSDIGNIKDIFSNRNNVLIPNPVYPAYIDVNIMSGGIIFYLNANVLNHFLPLPKDINGITPDIIYLCSPNNPTGAVYNREQLTEWVEYASQVGAVILFDAAYECFIQDISLPRSIFEIPGAKECTIEFCSLSKTAGFTGTRCGYTIVPKTLRVPNSKTERISLHKLWLRRQTTKFNGVSYIIQKGAAAVFTEEGQNQIKENIDYYMENAHIIADTMKEKGIEYYGGDNSPYIWLKSLHNMKSWEFFDFLLNKIAVVSTPGAGFGDNGEGFLRLSAFGSREGTIEAMQRWKKLL
ncbi:MAG: LL-diaminopimelate aminotransferase [Anaerocolumna sp.]